MTFRYGDCEYAVVGAGPYGMAVASYLRAVGLRVRIFGKVMDFWENQMPKGMKLRSPIAGSHIADPEGALTLGRYAAAQDRSLPVSLPLEEFVRYGRWFQSRSLPDLDSRNVLRIDRCDTGYQLTLGDGERLLTANVVIATGIGSFANYPLEFRSLPLELVSHCSDRANRDLGRFKGQRVVVVGSGQSALESAALLLEAGAEVEVLMRQPRVRYLKSGSYLEWLMDCRLSPFRAPGKIGPIGMNWLIEHPRLFTLFPRGWQDWMTRRAIRPAGSSWLRPRHQGVTFRVSGYAVGAVRHGNRIRVALNDGQGCEADHVLLGTGYKVDVAGCEVLSAKVLGAVRAVNGYPVLNAGFESSLPGLYFVGATAAHSFGPLCRFVAGTSFTATTIAKYVRNKKAAVRPLVTAQA